MAAVLEGIRVLDMTVWQQGPYASAMLADLGADVIKVEAPEQPDPGRTFLWHSDLRISAYWEAHNRGKRSLALNLKHPKGHAAFMRLARTADVFLNNLRMGVTERLGVGYDALRAVKPDIIYVHASAYGRHGPDAGLGSFDILAQARGGIMSVNAGDDGRPRSVPTPIADQVGAMIAAFATMAALFHRERTGEGQEVDISLLGSQLALQSFNITSALLTGRLPKPQRRGGFNPLWNTYEAADGKYFTVAMLEQRWWGPFCRAIGQPELENDPRYATVQARHHGGEALIDHLDKLFATRPAAEWVRLLQEHGLFASLVQDYSDIPGDPQVIANGYIQDVPAPGRDAPIPMVAAPLRLSKADVGPKRAAPRLGEHTEEVLLEAGLSPEEVHALAAEGIALCAPPLEAGEAART